ncbi:MAG: ferritin-like domain-containing protein [Acidobacteriota bacterium]|nr:ferritin-like domain-containing protein [Acidobacteriota bacterium]
MNNVTSIDSSANRRSFLRKGLVAAGAAAGSTLLAQNAAAFAEDEDSGGLTKGDAAILRFLAAAELIESDLWVQYNELGGVQDSERQELGGGGSPIYTSALSNLDSDMAQYIHDNTDDELSHAEFLNAYLSAKGADTVDLDRFRNLPSSKASGALQIGRLTNLMQLTVDTSWFTRYRSSANNPDLDPSFTFPQAVAGLAKGQHPAIPRTDDDLTPKDHIQAIANTAGFHFGFIEQGGTSLYPSLAQRVTSPRVLLILLSIGPTETMHFQTWHDKAGNGVNGSILPSPLIDPKDPSLVFPNLNINPGGQDFQTNLIMPEPCPFLRKFPPCSIIRPTSTKGAAMGAVRALTSDGLFIGQSKEFFALLRDLAEDADKAMRES